jgi:hypothetical protein
MILGSHEQEQRRDAFHRKRQMPRPNETRDDKQEGQTQYEAKNWVSPKAVREDRGLSGTGTIRNDHWVTSATQ